MNSFQLIHALVEGQMASLAGGYLHLLNDHIELVVVGAHALQLRLDRVQRIAYLVRNSRIQQSLHLLRQLDTLVDDLQRDVAYLQHELVLDAVRQAEVVRQLALGGPHRALGVRLIAVLVQVVTQAQQSYLEEQEALYGVVAHIFKLVDSVQVGATAELRLSREYGIFARVLVHGKHVGEAQWFKCGLPLLVLLVIRLLVVEQVDRYILEVAEILLGLE